MHQHAFTMPNKFFVTASSNADDAALITNADRKWAIAEMQGAPLTAKETEWLFSFLGTEADQEHAAAVLRHYFASVDISTFNPNARAPYTEAKAAMVAANTASDHEALVVMWEQREPPFDRDVVLTAEAMAAVHKRCPMKPSMHRVAKLLSLPPIHGKSIQFRAGEGRYRAMAVRNPDMWVHARGKLILDHIEGNDADIADPLLA